MLLWTGEDRGEKTECSFNLTGSFVVRGRVWSQDLFLICVQTCSCLHQIFKAEDILVFEKSNPWHVTNHGAAYIVDCRCTCVYSHGVPVLVTTVYVVIRVVQRWHRPPVHQQVWVDTQTWFLLTRQIFTFSLSFNQMLILTNPEPAGGRQTYHRPTSRLEDLAPVVETQTPAENP